LESLDADEWPEHQGHQADLGCNGEDNECEGLSGLPLQLALWMDRQDPPADLKETEKLRKPSG
jgi:hypothetical protein